MTKSLSPAAQAVLDAAVQAVIDACTNSQTYMNWATRYAAAAALRAAADHIQFEGQLGMTAYGGHAQAQSQLNTIAAELEGSNG